MLDLKATPPKHCPPFTYLWVLKAEKAAASSVEGGKGVTVLKDEDDEELSVVY